MNAAPSEQRLILRGLGKAFGGVQEVCDASPALSTICQRR